MVSRRAQAAIAAGVLAFSAGASAPVAIAAEPDLAASGATVPGSAGDDATLSPDFDPGGESAELPVAPQAPQVPAPAVPENDDVAPLEPEPVTDAAPVAPGDVLTAPPPVTAQPTPPPAPPPPDAAVGEETPEASTSPAPAETKEPGVKEPSGAEDRSTDASDDDGDRSQDADGRGDGGGKSHDGGPSVRTQHKAAPPASGAPAPATTTSTVAAQTSPPTTTPTVPAGATPAARSGEPQTAHALAVATTAGGRVKPGDTTHVVRPGESLWTIAADLLGGRPSVARVAREVNRLWTLNENRIGTGDPDLLRVGTQLRLR